MTLPPTSVHVIVWCGDTPVVLRSLGDRCERHKRASRAWSARWPASPKGRIESEPRGPSQLRGVRGVARIAPSQLRIVTIRHGLKVFVIILPCFGHFGWPFPSQDGPPEKKSHLESGLNQRDRATAGFGRDRSHGKPSKIFYCRGFLLHIATFQNFQNATRTRRIMR